MGILKIPVTWHNSKGDAVSPVGNNGWAHPFMNIEVAGVEGGPWLPIKAMIDTALSRTCLKAEFFPKINSPSVRAISINGASGWQEMPVHWFHLRFPQFPMGTIKVEGLAQHAPLYGAEGLVGMDVISHGTLHLDRVSGDSYFNLPLPEG